MTKIHIIEYEFSFSSCAHQTSKVLYKFLMELLCNVSVLSLICLLCCYGIEHIQVSCSSPVLEIRIRNWSAVGYFYVTDCCPH